MDLISCFLVILCLFIAGSSSSEFHSIDSSSQLDEGDMAPIDGSNTLQEGPSTPFSPDSESFKLPTDLMDLYTCLSSRSHEIGTGAVSALSISVPTVNNVIFLGTKRWSDIATLDFIETPLVFVSSQQLDKIKGSARIQFGLHLLAEEAEALENLESVSERQQFLSALKRDFESKTSIALHYIVSKFELSQVVAESLDLFEVVYFRANPWACESTDDPSGGFLYVDTEEEGRFEEFLRETYDIRDSDIIFV